MIISNYIYKLIGILFLFSVLFGFNGYSQDKKLQRIGFVDIEYVLDNIPSYAEAQSKLDSETTTWKTNLDKMYLKLTTMKEEFLNEKPLLTEDLIKEREVEIKNHENEITKAENTYFGVEGKLFELKQQLVQPYQDLVYNAVQTIAQLRKYDMIFEKSSSIVMLYTNNNYDISELVLKYIQKSKKEIEREEADIKKQIAKEARQKRIEEQKKKREETRLKRIEDRKRRSKNSKKVEETKEKVTKTEQSENKEEEQTKEIEQNE